MTAAAVTRLTPTKGLIPAKGTAPIAAAVMLIKGTLVSETADGHADIVHSAQRILGVSTQTYDNTLGAAGDISAQLEFGVFGFVISGSTPKPGDVMFAVDNQTISTSSSGGTRGVAGFLISIGEDGFGYIYVAPHVGSAYADVAAVTVTANAAGADAKTLAVTEVHVPLASLIVSTTGAPVPAFANNSADGLTFVDSKAMALRINNASTTVFAGSVKLPADLDVTKAVTLKILAGRVGSTDTSAVLTPHVWAQHAGSAHDAGADLVSGNTGALSGATKVVTAVSKALASAPAANDGLTFTLVVGSLPTDDMLIYDIWFECSRTVTSA